MGIMVENFKSSSPKKDMIKNTKGNNNKFSRTSLLEVLAQGGNIASYTADDGTIRMKILVKKQDLKKIMSNASANQNFNPNNNGPSSPIERRLHDLMMMKKKKANNNANNKNRKSSSSWRPVLQSIPEEHY